MCVVFVFFFQAEDGIRDLVRSRGLGDVYKRQPWQSPLCPHEFSLALSGTTANTSENGEKRYHSISVSYTHLTLPTIYSV